MYRNHPEARSTLSFRCLLFVLFCHSEDLLSGFVAGCAAATANNPFDVIKTRQQAGQVPLCLWRCKWHLRQVRLFVFAVGPENQNFQELNGWSFILIYIYTYIFIYIYTYTLDFEDFFVTRVWSCVFNGLQPTNLGRGLAWWKVVAASVLSSHAAGQEGLMGWFCWLVFDGKMLWFFPFQDAGSRINPFKATSTYTYTVGIQRMEYNSEVVTGNERQWQLIENTKKGAKRSKLRAACP